MSALETAAASISPNPSPPRIIKVDALARVEGEGALYVRVRDRQVQDIKFRIYEPPRFFEGLLKGRPFSDAPDITARICGICPIAYLTGASQAMEMALGVTLPPGPLHDLRRMVYCGEWIQSHVLHAYMLHAPDFLGMADAIEIARAHPGVVERGLRMKQLGNRLLEVIGGRACHPVNLKVGGFYRAPTVAEIRALIAPLERAVEDALETIRLFASFDFPNYEDDYTFVALKHPEVYAIEEGRIVNNRGLDLELAEFERHYGEDHVAHSTALQGVLYGDHGPAYLVGPLARYALSYDQLTPLCHQAAREAGMAPVERNPFRSLLVRGIETLYACEEALRLAKGYEEPDRPAVPVTPRAGRGFGCTEAPRGICYHRYDLDDEGRILSARIMSPTAQNQKIIEADLKGVVQRNLDLDDEALKWRCEQTIRNYDPCISCSTHVLTLTVDRD